MPAGSPSARTIRIILVDDHEVVLDGLEANLRLVPDFKVVAKARTRLDALATIERERPDVVLFDLILDEVEEWGTIDTILNRFPKTKIIVISARSEIAVGLESLRHRTCGFLNKAFTTSMLEAHVRAALHGNIVGGQVLLNVLRRIGIDESGHLANLTKGEKAILRLLQRGLTVDVIADRVKIKEATVRSHARNIQEKLGLSSLHELYVWAIYNQPVK